MPHTDTPCQAGDTNQVYPEQDNTPAPRAAASINDTAIEVPPDWEPSAADATEALRLCPGADLSTHTAHFRARCRARGYRYRAGHLGDAWLAWLLEDYGAPSRRTMGRTPPGPLPAADGSARLPPSPTLRFAAWAVAAAFPAPARAASPWS